MKSCNFHMGKCNWVFYWFEKKRKQVVKKEIQDGFKILNGLNKQFPWFMLQDFLDVLEGQLDFNVNA